MMKYKAKKDKVFRQLTVGLKTQLCKECKEMGRRLCEVDGKPAFFHRWVDEDKVLLKINTMVTRDAANLMRQDLKEKGLIGPGCNAEKLHHTFALVEYEDGSVSKVEPEKVRFKDRRVNI